MGPLELRKFNPHEDGPSPFDAWLDSLCDNRAVAIVAARLARVRLGLMGDHKAVGGGVSELRIDFGPGLRIYFGRDGAKVIILLAGGSKRSQAKDIARAQALWKEYLNAKD
ncbi:MAG: type II toxin-antitoxin system RelE/ParE family toxin [Acidobacteria bacterium]|nr:type II toxin-antitoxin system RelE/ParE family toxin [Acidobacteriota bacterium]